MAHSAVWSLTNRITHGLVKTLFVPHSLAVVWLQCSLYGEIPCRVNTHCYFVPSLFFHDFVFLYVKSMESHELQVKLWGECLALWIYQEDIKWINLNRYICCLYSKKILRQSGGHPSKASSVAVPELEPAGNYCPTLLNFDLLQTEP